MTKQKKNINKKKTQTKNPTKTKQTTNICVDKEQYMDHKIKTNNFLFLQGTDS